MMASTDLSGQSGGALTVVILTFNSESTIASLLRSIEPLRAKVIVVDSYSSDQTCSIATLLGAEVLQNPFENYAAQRRWAEAQAKIPRGEWILHLDSDEIPSTTLVDSIHLAISNGKCDGYLVRRVSYFWGKQIRHGHMNPSWHLRLYKSGRGRCELRLYDQHFLCDGTTGKLEGELLDLQRVSLTAWTNSHNRWSSAEANEACRTQKSRNEPDQLKPNLRGDVREKKRWVKENIWYRLPLLSRPFFLFFYNYVLKLGILDGSVGLVYHVLHAFWFRFLVDAKMLEILRYQNSIKGPVDESWLLLQGVRFPTIADQGTAATLHSSRQPK